MIVYGRTENKSIIFRNNEVVFTGYTNISAIFAIFRAKTVGHVKINLRIYTLNRNYTRNRNYTLHTKLGIRSHKSELDNELLYRVTFFSLVYSWFE